MAFKIYGSFKSKKRAKTSERKHSGSFIRRRKVRGSIRYIVLKRRK